MRDGGDDLLGEDVEGVAEDGGRFDETFVHGAGDGGAGYEVGAVFGEDDAFAGDSNLVTCAADALHASGDRGRRLDLNDEVDGAHIDAELKLVFDLRALGGGEGAVMGAGQGFLG